MNSCEYNKIGKQYSFCNRCKYEDDFKYSNKCLNCTKIVDCKPSMFLCGIPVGRSLYYLHKNFSEKECEK